MNRIAALLAPAFFSLLGTGCLIETGDPAPLANSAEPAPQPAPSSPQVAVVDPDRTLTAKAGDGVGVFVEYRTGGTWTISWTCDTARSSQSCPFTIHVAGSELTLVDKSISKGTASATASAVDASSETDFTVDSMTFRGKPGGRILLDATVGGLHDGSYLFFVQDGKVNGGYTGALSNPIYLEPKKP